MVGLPILNGCGSYKPAYGHCGGTTLYFGTISEVFDISVGGWDQLVRWVY